MASIPLEYVSLPPDTESQGSTPGLFVLHGRGADERDLLPVTERLPDKYHVVSLRAPEPMGPGYTWYDLDLSGGGLHESQPDPDGFRRSLDLVAESVDTAIETFGLREQVGFLGFSQGAITSTATLLERPERVAWLAALHGYLPESHADIAPQGVEGTPVFAGRGATDEIIPADRAVELADRLRAIGCEVTGGTFQGGHGIGPDELAALVEFVEAQTD